jgi:hypothetical protein
MSLDLTVYCPNNECEFHQKPILLPASTLPQTVDDPKGWPEDGTYLYLACPACRRVSAHFHGEPIDLPEASQSEFRKDTDWLRVNYVCGVEHCKSPAEFRVLVRKGEDKSIRSELLDKLRLGHWTGNLPCGHPIVPHAG